MPIRKIAAVLIVLVIWVIDLKAQNPLEKVRKGYRKIKQIEREKNKAQKDLSKLFSQEKREVTDEESVLDSIIWEKPTYIPKRGMINDYPFTYKMINGFHQRIEFRSDELTNGGKLTKIFWDSVSNTYYNRFNKVDGISDSSEVFGWHPYWMKNEYEKYKLDLLSTISYFSYDVNPENGSWNDDEAIDDWTTTPLIDSARSKGVNVLLTVTNYGEEENKEFLNHPSRWKTLVNNLDTLLQSRGAQGVDIDFEGISSDQKSHFTDLITQVYAKLGGESILTIQIKPYNNREAIDFEILSEYVDYFILQGFDYNAARCNGDPGPVSPLLSINSDCACIVNSFDYLIRKGVPADKIVLGLPAYGTSWIVSGSGLKQRQQFEKYLTYDDIMVQYASQYQPNYDPISGSTFFALDNGDNTSRIIWYEGKQSLNRKFAWAIEHELKGVGIWALGYGGSSQDIWEVIAENYGRPLVEEIEPDSIVNGPVFGLVATVDRNRRVIGFSVLIIAGFFLIGLLGSLLDWRVREAFFSSYAYRALLSGVLILLFSVALILILPNAQPYVLLFLGMVAGGTIVYVVTNRYLAYRDKLP